MKQELGRISQRRNFIGWLRESEIQALVRKAYCLFIFAVTACRFINDTNWDPEERLFEVLQNQAGGGATGELDEIYMQVLRHYLTMGQRKGDIARLCTRFQGIVGAIVVLFDELSVAEFAQLLAVPVKTPEACLGTLHSVLNIPKDLEGPIRLLHPSFHDFLLNQERCEDERLWVEEKLVHAKLFLNCMSTLSTKLKRNIYRLST